MAGTTAVFSISNPPVNSLVHLSANNAELNILVSYCNNGLNLTLLYLAETDLQLDNSLNSRYN